MGSCEFAVGIPAINGTCTLPQARVRHDRQLRIHARKGPNSLHFLRELITEPKAYPTSGERLFNASPHRLVGRPVVATASKRFVFSRAASPGEVYRFALASECLPRQGDAKEIASASPWERASGRRLGQFGRLNNENRRAIQWEVLFVANNLDYSPRNPIFMASPAGALRGRIDWTEVLGKVGTGVHYPI